MAVNRSQSSVTDKDPNRLSTKFKYSAAKTSQGGGNFNLADSGDKIVDFDLSESKYTHQVHAVKDSPRQRQDPALMSMDSMDFGLSESNMSHINFS